MMGWYGSGGWGVGSWIGMGLIMVVVWGLVVFGIVALLRWTSRGRPQSAHAPTPPNAATPTALQHLDERFARGDLTEEQYRRTREILQGR